MSTSWASIVSRSSLSLFALLCASAVSAQEFYLSSQGIVMPGETATVSLSTRTLKSVDVRVYRLSDPAAFFRAQSNPHAPRPVTAGGGAPSGVSLTESVAEAGASALSRYRDLARAILDGDVREKVAGDLGIGTGETKVETARAGAPARAIPLLPGYALVRRFTHVIQRDQKEAWWRDETIPVFDQKAETGSYLVEVVAGPARAYTVALVSNLRFVAKQGPAEGAARLVFVAQADSGRPVAGARVTTLPTSEDAKKSAAPVAAVTDASGLASLPASTGTSTLLVSKDKDFLLSDVYFYNASEEWGEGAESPTHVSPGRAYIYTDRPIYRPDQQVFFKALLRVKDGEGRYTLAAAESAAVSVLDSQDRKIYEAKLAASDLGCLDGSLTLSSQPSLGSYTIKVAWQKRVDYGHFRVEEYKKPEFEVKVATDRERYITGDTLEIDVDAKYYFGDAVAGGKVEWEIYHAKYFRPWWEDYALRWFFASEQGYHTYDYEQLEQGEGTLDENGRLHVRLASRGRSGQDEVYRIVARVTDATNRQLSGVKIVPVAAGLFRIELDSERYAAGVGESLNLSVKTRTSEDQPTSERVQIVIERSIWEKGKTRKQTAESRVVTTDSTGAARFAFTPREPGSYSIQASAQDSRGNALASSYFFWAWSEKPWWSESSGEGLTLTPDKKVYAAGDTAALLLVSPVENPTVLFTIEGPRIFEQKVVTASGTTATIPIPIRDVYSPNVYATAAVIAGGKYYSQEALIVIPPKDRFLKIDIGTDRPVYRPGDKVALTLTVKDEQGQPVDAELSVGIVDLSIYALAPESAPDIKGFFYGQRPNEVSTSYSTDFSQYTSARSEARRKGDDLRWADFKSISQTRIRKVFKDTMFWQAVVRTGSSGVAQLPAVTPDNLTTWRITVRAIDRSTRVGQQTATFIVRKDLMIRLGLPRFFRARDRGQVAATIHNSQEKPAQVKVKFEAQGISINGATEQVISLDKRSRQTLFWNYEAQQAGTARFTAYALSEGLSDAEQLDIPVLPHGTEVVEASSRIVEKERDSLTLKPNFGGTAQPEGVAAQLTLAPSLAGPLMASLEYLVAYPYGCVEQTMSAFLPTVLVAQTTKELGGEMPQSGKLKDIPQMVAKGLARLYNYQHEDGGWGWWENDPTHSFMTAYALYGLTRAQQAGFEVDQTVLERGRNSLISLLGQTDLDLATRAYMLYVLKQAGSTDRTMIEKLFARRKELAKNMNPMTRALMVETLAAHGLASEARALLEELLAEAQRVDSLVYWEGQSWHYNWQDDPLLTTAAALRAILAVEPKRAEAVGAMRFLMSRKLDERSWRSTLDTAQIVYVLVDYMKARRELSADFEVEVRAGGKRVLNQRFDKGDLFKAPVALPIPSEVLKDGVEIKKTGAGNLYATLRTSYYTQEEGIAPRSGGSLRIDRRYEHLALTRQGDKFIYRRTPLGENAVVAPGDLVLVTIAPTTTADSEYVMIEDMLPSGFEVIADTRGWRIEGLPVHEYEEYGWGEWYSHREVRDNRVAFFVTYFGRGQKEPMRYILRAQTRGDYHVMPARVEVMYYPDTRATSPETRIRVE